MMKRLSGNSLAMTDDSKARRWIIALYLCLLMFHAAHVLEEIYGHFRAIGYFGLFWFLLINWILICIPAIVFYFILIGKRWAYYCGIIYAAILIINGLMHNIGLIITRQYYGGVAGSFTGLAYLVIGPLVIVRLQKMVKEDKQ